MRIIVSLCIIFFLSAFNACEDSRSPVVQTDISGIWKGQIDSNMMEIRLSVDGSTLSGEVVWQVGDPAFIANIGAESHRKGDSVFIILTASFDPPRNIVSMSGQIAGNIMSGAYYKLHQSAPLSDSGFWATTKERE